MEKVTTTYIIYQTYPASGDDPIILYCTIDKNDFDSSLPEFVNDYYDYTGSGSGICFKAVKVLLPTMTSRLVETCSGAGVTLSDVIDDIEAGKYTKDIIEEIG